ncbi:MAG TPA: hypothetical protein VMJ93_16220 [Verrucomicrobiae bacterium]|nr:hypothetical protein [Verrucomicrobiae bacterium]
MSDRGPRLLVVGVPSPPTQSILNQLQKAGTPAVVSRTVQEALLALGNSEYAVVLASELLPDGRAYELMPAIERTGGSLLVSVALSESQLWLPVVEHGRRVLGSRALNSRMLEYEVDRLMAPILPPALRMQAARPGAAGSSDARRKILARRAAAIPLRLETRRSLDSRSDSLEELPAALPAAAIAGKGVGDESGRLERDMRRSPVGDRRTA